MKAKRTAIWTLVSVILLAGAAFGVWKIFISRSYTGETVRIYIPGGSSEAAVCDSLGRLGSFGDVAARLWRLQGGTVEEAHGSYLVEDGMTAANLARRLAKGQESPIRFTFNNIRTFDRLAARVGARFETDSAAFMAASAARLDSVGFNGDTYAAAVLPDTYEFYWTARPEFIIDRLADVRGDFWNAERRAKAQALGLTPVQVATVASIVEEESNNAAERPVIARLYLNRLDRNMPLQADPTIKFALGDFGLRRIGSEQLRAAAASPYSTYARPGLPPGPIRIVEKTTIDQVLDAPAHNYIYMCAKPDFSGTHDFAETYDRHRINAARYHRALNARGINR